MTAPQASVHDFVVIVLMYVGRLREEDVVKLSQ